MNTIAKKIQTSKDFEQLKTQPKTTRTAGRAESLADRIEVGAASLAAFAEGLSEEEWRTPVSESGRDGRSVGVIVHHVASLYPLEIDLARTIASGKAVTDVTWKIVAEMNAKHAHDQAGVTKATALELLRRTVVRQPPQYARSLMRNWTVRRPSR